MNTFIFEMMWCISVGKNKKFNKIKNQLQQPKNIYLLCSLCGSFFECSSSSEPKRSSSFSGSFSNKNSTFRSFKSLKEIKFLSHLQLQEINATYILINIIVLLVSIDILCNKNWFLWHTCWMLNVLRAHRRWYIG